MFINTITEKMFDILGAQQGAVDAVNACTTIEELDTVKATLGI